MQSFSEVRMLFFCLLLHQFFVAARASVPFEDCALKPLAAFLKTRKQSTEIYFINNSHVYYKTNNHKSLLCELQNIQRMLNYGLGLNDTVGSAYDLQTVYIEGCGMRLPCYVTLGDNITVNLQFIAAFDSSQLDQDVTININYIHAKTPVTPEPCEMGLCPVKRQAQTTLTSIMSVPTNMALNQRGYLEWRVYNENGMQVLCYYVMVQTQNYFQKYLRHLFGNSEMSYEPRRNFTEQ